MFERFTDQARKVVVHAQHEAEALGYEAIDPSHLVLGILAEEGIGRTALELSGVTGERLRTALEWSAPMNPPERTGHVPFTDEGKKALEMALQEAMSLGREAISPEHLLLAILELEPPQLVELCDTLAFSLDDVRVAVMDGIIAEHLKPDLAAVLMAGSRASVAAQAAALGPVSAGSMRRTRVIYAESGSSETPGEPTVRRVARDALSLPVCSFCGAAPSSSTRLVGGANAFICDGCVANAAALLDPSPGDGVSSPEGEGQGEGALWPVPDAHVSRVSPMESWRAAHDVARLIRLAFALMLEEGDDGLAHVVGGTKLAGLPERLARATADFTEVEVLVEDVEFHSDVSAVVQFELMLGGRSAGVLNGKAVLDGDTWRVDRATVAHIARLAGVDIDAPPRPTAPPDG